MRQRPPIFALWISPFCSLRRRPQHPLNPPRIPSLFTLSLPPPPHSRNSARLKALADAQRLQDVDRLLAHYEKKDAVAQQLEAITKMTVRRGEERGGEREGRR